MTDENQMVGDISFVKVKTKNSTSEQTYAIKDKQLSGEVEELKKNGGSVQISYVSNADIAEICK